MANNSQTGGQSNWGQLGGGPNANATTAAQLTSPLMASILGGAGGMASSPTNGISSPAQTTPSGAVNDVVQTGTATSGLPAALQQSISAANPAANNVPNPAGAVGLVNPPSSGPSAGATPPTTTVNPLAALQGLWGGPFMAGYAGMPQTN